MEATEHPSDYAAGELAAEAETLDVVVRERHDELDRMVRTLRDLRRARDAINSAETVLRSRIGEALGEARRAVPGVGIVETTFTVPARRYDRDALSRAVLDRATQARILDPRTGEVETEAEARLRLARECFRWEARPGAIKKHGIDPDLYTDGEPRPGSWTVKLVEEA